MTDTVPLRPKGPVAVIVAQRAEALLVGRILAPILGEAGLLVLVTGHQAAAVREAVAKAVEAKAQSIISCGVAAGLIAGLKPGTIVIAASVVLPTEDVLPVNPALLKQAIACLKEQKPWVGPVVGVDRLPDNVEEKTTLHAATAAWAADGQSHIALLAARQADIPFLAVLVVFDPADRVLPRLLRGFWQIEDMPSFVRPLVWAIRPLLWRDYRRSLASLGQHLALLGIVWRG
jgi:adenosylhomocysteine nucleosidase